MGDALESCQQAACLWSKLFRCCQVCTVTDTQTYECSECVCVPHPVCVMCCGNPQGCWESLSWEVCVLWDCVVGWSRQASGDPVGFCLPPLLGLECTADTAHVDCSHSPTNDAYLPTYAMGLGVRGPLMPLYRCAYHSVPS